MMNSRLPTPTRHPSFWRPSLIAAALLGLSACASTPEPPTQQLQAAESAIANAERARVVDVASPELTAAREHLAAAKQAVANENMTAAMRFAERAQLDAQLAAARAEATRAQAVNDEMRKSTEAIKQEMQRNTGARP